MSRTSPRLTPLAVGLVAAVLLVACDKKTTTTTTPSGTATTTTVAPAPATTSAMNSAGNAVSDSAVTAKVKTALLADDNVKGLQIDVDTKGGVVTLNGTADTQANMSKAQTIAQGIEGVKSVENKLTVKP
ncbi:MAG TPA: BON domain-containing protein [Caldimonas sp.]|jgi:hyperosmotically inducible protein|nr:BON domain-containing protein [Caldimonas sp.]HEX2539529.1 BON domain-containing protein [Caldimonas sp.]